MWRLLLTIYKTLRRITFRAFNMIASPSLDRSLLPRCLGVAVLLLFLVMIFRNNFSGAPPLQSQKSSGPARHVGDGFSKDPSYHNAPTIPKDTSPIAAKAESQKGGSETHNRLTTNAKSKQVVEHDHSKLGSGALSQPSTNSKSEVLVEPNKAKSASNKNASSQKSSKIHQLHVIISHYGEDPKYIRAWTGDLRALPYLRELGVKVFIYTKHPEVDLGALKDAAGADEVVRLPNVGREGGTFLHHMLFIYDDPPKFILTGQAVLIEAQIMSGDRAGHLQGWYLDRMRQYFRDDIGFMSMEKFHDTCYCGHCTDLGHDHFYPLWPQIYAMLENKICREVEGQILSFHGHFIVSAKRIRSRPRKVYKYLQELVDAPQEDTIHLEWEPQWTDGTFGESTPRTPKFGHTLERLWHTIFSCYEPEEVVYCDISDEDTRGEGGCACLDS